MLDVLIDVRHYFFYDVIVKCRLLITFAPVDSNHKFLVASPSAFDL